MTAVTVTLISLSQKVLEFNYNVSKITNHKFKTNVLKYNSQNESELRGKKGKKREVRWAGGGASDAAPRVRARPRYCTPLHAAARSRHPPPAPSRLFFLHCYGINLLLIFRILLEKNKLNFIMIFLFSLIFCLYSL